MHEDDIDGSVSFRRRRLRENFHRTPEPHSPQTDNTPNCVSPVEPTLLVMNRVPRAFGEFYAWTLVTM
jgi:hypothetical protein